jgi:hypothetical protein
MDTLRRTIEAAAEKIRKVVKDITGDGKLPHREMAETRQTSEEKGDPGRFNPLGNLDKLT